MANERPMTLSEVRALLWKHATADAADTSGDFTVALNEALERIHSEGLVPETVERVNLATSGYITNDVCQLPYLYDIMLAVNVDEVPREIIGQQLEFMPNGPGQEDAGEGGSVVIDLGFVEVAGEMLRQYKFLMDVDAAEVEGLLRRRYVYLAQDTDYVKPANLGALKHALLGIVFENEGDLDRALEYWEECNRILNAEESTIKSGTHDPSPANPWGFMTDKPMQML
jgi:hypothetical protein